MFRASHQPTRAPFFSQTTSWSCWRFGWGEKKKERKEEFHEKFFFLKKKMRFFFLSPPREPTWVHRYLNTVKKYWQCIAASFLPSASEIRTFSHRKCSLWSVSFGVIVHTLPEDSLNGYVWGKKKKQQPKNKNKKPRTNFVCCVANDLGSCIWPPFFFYFQKPLLQKLFGPPDQRDCPGIVFKDTHGIFIPVLDMLNHDSGAAVVWLVCWSNPGGNVKKISCLLCVFFFPN